MKILINLIGEQPIPNLLPILHFKPDKTIVMHTQRTFAVALRLQKIVKNIELVSTKPFDFPENIKKLHSIYEDSGDYIFNITGGTKIMSVALFQFALEKKAKVVYLESQNNINKLVYVIENNEISNQVEMISELIDVETYIKAHVSDFYLAKPENPNLFGVKFENAIIQAIKSNGFEVLQGVKPKKEGDQLEIDAVIKKKGTNNFAIVEVKSGGEDEKRKQGIDQLSTAGSREYLGIYTKRILISRLKVNDSLKKLAKKHNVKIIDQIHTDRQMKIRESDKYKLIEKLNETL